MMSYYKILGLALCLSLAYGQIQLSHPEIALQFPCPIEGPKGVCPIGSLSRYDMPTSIYAMMGWVKLEEPLNTNTTIISVVNGANKHGVRLSKTTSGDIIGTLDLIDGTSVTKVIQSKVVINEWEHLAIMTCSINGEWHLKICTSEWEGTPHCQVFDLPTDPIKIDTDRACGSLGGDPGVSITGQMVDVRFYTGHCFIQDEVKNIVDKTTCASDCTKSCQCTRACHGPGNKSCIDYTSVVEISPASVVDVADYWSNLNPIFKIRYGPDVTASGWFYQTENKDVYTNLIRLQNLYCDVGKGGCRVLSVFTKSTNEYLLAVDTTQVVNNHKYMTPGFPIVNNWIFVAASNCYQHGENKSFLCIAKWGDTQVKCIDIDYIGTPYTWGEGEDNRIWFGGDPWFNAYKGKIADGRLYNRCLDKNEMDALMQDKNTSCAPGCANCISPEECEECHEGFFSAKA